MQVTLGKDLKTGDVLLPLTQEMMDTLGVVEGDKVEFAVLDNGTVSVNKATANSDPKMISVVKAYDDSCWDNSSVETF